MGGENGRLWVSCEQKTEGLKTHQTALATFSNSAPTRSSSSALGLLRSWITCGSIGEGKEVRVLVGSRSEWRLGCENNVLWNGGKSTWSTAAFLSLASVEKFLVTCCHWTEAGACGQPLNVHKHSISRLFVSRVCPGL
jgi:hypothetical protein